MCEACKNEKKNCSTCECRKGGVAWIGCSRQCTKCGRVICWDNSKFINKNGQ